MYGNELHRSDCMSSYMLLSTENTRVTIECFISRQRQPVNKNNQEFYIYQYQENRQPIKTDRLQLAYIIRLEEKGAKTKLRLTT